MPKFASRALVALYAIGLSAIAHAHPFSFAAIGDVPYGSVEELSQLSARVNRVAPAFTIHVGDFKSGGSLCSDEAFATVRQLFNEFDQPLVYTPGDNEWTDCHRRSCGQYDPLERLDKLRSMFFATEQSLGRRKLTLQSQGMQAAQSIPSTPSAPSAQSAPSAPSAQAGFRRFVENRRWAVGRVSFVTLHLVGSNNNWQPELPSVSEFAGREEANIAWLRDSFAQASARKDAAIVLAMQADTFVGEPRADSGFTRWLAALAEEIERWGKPVLLIQGDTHRYKVDQPLKTAQGKPLKQLTRVVIPGEREADAVLVDVDEGNPAQPFRLRLLGANSR